MCVPGSGYGADSNAFHSLYFRGQAKGWDERRIHRAWRYIQDRRWAKENGTTAHEMRGWLKAFGPLAEIERRAPWAH